MASPPRPWLLCTCLVTALPAASVLAAPRAACEAWRGADRVYVQVAVDDFLDGDLVELLRLGLAGRLSLDVTLVRRRRFWFDERLETSHRELVLGWDTAGKRLTLSGAAAGDPGHLRPERLALWPGRPLDDGPHAVEVSAELQVVTPGSLGQVARWMVGGRAPAGRGVLSRLLAETVARDLIRSDEASCRVTASAPRAR